MPSPVISVICFREEGVIFSLSSQEAKKKKYIITPDLRLPGRKKALPNSYSRLLWMQTKSLKRLEVLDFSKGEIPSFLVLLFSF